MNGMKLNEDGKLMVTLAAIIVAGQSANPSLVNPSTYLEPSRSMQLAADLIRYAMNYSEFTEVK